MMGRLSLILVLTLGSVAFADDRDWVAHERWTTAAAFDSAGERLATASDDQRLKIWKLPGGELATTIAVNSPLTTIAWGAADKFVLTGCWNGTVQGWNISTGEQLFSLAAHAENITGLALSRDGLLLATASGDDRCKVWNLANRRCLLTIEQENEYDATCVDFSPDAKFIAVGDGENSVKVYRVESGELLLTLTGHREAVSAVVFAPNGERILSASSDDTIRIWDATTGAELRTLRGHTDDIAGLALDRSGARLLSGGADRLAILWDLSTGKELERWTVPSAAITAAALSPDGRRITLGSHRRLRVREVSR